MNGRRWALLITPLILLLFAAFYFGLGRDPSAIPSPLVGKPLPPISGVDLQGKVRSLPTRGRPALVNVWASWCSACVAEHQVIVAAARKYGDRVDFIGLNYRDKLKDAERWLSRLGDPYLWSLHDLEGRAGIELGVYGAPETYFLDADGMVVDKKIGPLVAEEIEFKLVEKLGINN